MKFGQRKHEDRDAVAQPTKWPQISQDIIKDYQHDLIRNSERRQDDLRIQESQHMREILQLRGEHYEQLRVDEARRIDAIRGVDVAAVAAAAAVQATQANTLAATVSTSAEAMRGQVGAAATAQTIALDNKIAPIQKDISDLRQAQYEQQGQKTQQQENKSDSHGKQGSIGLWITVAIMVVGLFSTVLFSIVGIAITLLLRK